METIYEKSLSEILLPGVNVRLIEPHIYSVLQDEEKPNFFDRLAGFYDIVICNSLYNRVVWGYSVSDYSLLIDSALTSSGKGWVLDAGCGSLAFTAKTYVKYAERPVIFLDQSLKLLRIAKSRLTRLSGGVPENMIFFYGDALRLPFKPQSFHTIISLNLLHVLHDIKEALLGMKNVLAEDGTMYFTTLIVNNRFADKYFRKFEDAGEAVARDIGQLRSAFDTLEMPVMFRIIGNMAFINYGSGKRAGLKNMDK